MMSEQDRRPLPGWVLALRARVRAISIAQKLALAFVLFLVPLVYVAWEFTALQRASIAFTAAERQGLAFARVVSAAQMSLDANMRAAQIGGPRVSNLADEASALALAQDVYGGAFDTAALTARAIETLHAAEDMSATHDASARTALRDLMRRISERSNLILDSELASYYAMESVLMRAPALREALRETTSGADAAGRDRRLSDGERQQLIAALSVACLAGFELTRSVEAAYASAGAGAAPGAALARVEGALRDYETELRRQAAARRLDVPALVALETRAAVALRRLSGLVSDELDRLLLARVQRLQREQLNTGLIAASLFIAAAGAILALLHFGLVRPVRSLIAPIGALSKGDFDTEVPQQNRRDEIGAIARAISMLRDSAKAKIEADAARAAAESANLAKSQFVANISHELRTPLNAIIGYGEILHEEIADIAHDGARRDVERVLIAARHLLTLINDILDLSKMEAGRTTLAPAPLDLRAFIDDIAQTVAPLTQANANAFSTHMDGAAPRLVIQDETRLRQCLLNLLSNACKFTRDGRVNLDVRVRPHDRALIFTVTDTGIGMNSAQIERLFQPFTQADETITRQFGGTGLGLMLTKKLAELLGGDVTVRSAPGEGSTFTLLVASELSLGEAPGSIGETPCLEAPDGPYILVIDDEADARDLAARAIAPLGWQVCAIANGARALDLARQRAPSLILLDLHLNGESGLSVLHALKSDVVLARTPVIVVSIDEDRRPSIAAGAADHLVKPIGRDLLAAAILRYIQPRAGEQTHTPPDTEQAAARASA